MFSTMTHSMLCASIYRLVKARQNENKVLFNTLLYFFVLQLLGFLLTTLSIIKQNNFHGHTSHSHQTRVINMLSLCLYFVQTALVPWHSMVTLKHVLGCNKSVARPFMRNTLLNTSIAVCGIVMMRELFMFCDNHNDNNMYQYFEHIFPAPQGDWFLHAVFTNIIPMFIDRKRTFTYVSSGPIAVVLSGLHASLFTALVRRTNNNTGGGIDNMTKFDAIALFGTY
jgi:hypothetical protein